MKRILAMLLSVMVLTILFPTTALAATSPYYSSVKQSSITQNNAVVTATIKNPSKVKLTEGGFYIGTKSGSAVKTGTKKTDKITGSWQTAKSIPCSYNFKNEYKITLKSNTKYYVVLYCKDSKNNYYYSDEISFTTKKSVTYSGLTVKSISTDTAIVTATINNPYGVKLTEGSFDIGQKSGTCMVNGSATDKITGSWQTAKSIPCSYEFKGEYGITLKENTTYFVELCCKDSSGNYYYSEEISFTTKAGTTATEKPKIDDSSTDETTASNVTPLTDEQYSVINANGVINFYPNDDYTIGDGACNLFSMTSLVRRMQALHGEDELLDCQTSLEYNNNTYWWDWATNGSWAKKIYQSIGYKVGYIRSPEQSIEEVEDYLREHPEGIVCYFAKSSSTQHSVLITREIDGHFYCIDYLNGAQKGKKTTASETLLEDASFRGYLGYSKDYAKLFAYLIEVAYITD